MLYGVVVWVIDPLAVIVVALVAMAVLFLGCMWGVRALIRWLENSIPAPAPVTPTSPVDGGPRVSSKGKRRR
jgi:hypothetical protein